MTEKCEGFSYGTYWWIPVYQVVILIIVSNFERVISSSVPWKWWLNFWKWVLIFGSFIGPAEILKLKIVAEIGTFVQLKFCGIQKLDIKIWNIIFGILWWLKMLEHEIGNQKFSNGDLNEDLAQMFVKMW